MKQNSDSVEKIVAIYSFIVAFFVFIVILAFSDNFQNRINRLEQRMWDNDIKCAPSLQAEAFGATGVKQYKNVDTYYVTVKESDIPKEYRDSLKGK